MMVETNGCHVRHAQVREPQAHRWTAKARTAFLQHLAATCNVAQSAKAAGLTASTAYALRLRDGEFARLWASAMETGYVRLEAALLRRALGAPQDANPTVADVVDTPDPPDADIDIDLALKLLSRHRAPDERSGKRGGRPLRAPSAQDIYQALERKITAIERRLVQGS